MDSRVMAIPKGSNSVPAPSQLYDSVAKGLSTPPSASLEIRLFFVRIAPCVADSAPDRLSLRHIRRQIGVSLDVNGSHIPASDPAALPLRRDRLHGERVSEVTYVSTDNVRVTGGFEFEVYEDEDLVLCGSLERIEPACCWVNGVVGVECDAKTGWSMDYYTAASISGASSSLFRPRIGALSPSVEVYIAGCCSGSPVILTKTVQVQVSPRRKPHKQGVLDAIPEDKEIGKETKNGGGLIHQPKLRVTEAETEDYEVDWKIEQHSYSENVCLNEEGQLSWFNAGVRVGVGISLGMCLGIGIGVGVLMRSYQSARRNFKWR